MLRATNNNFGMLCDTALVALYSGLMLLLCLVLIRMAIRGAGLTSLLAVLFFAVATAHYREGGLLQIGNAIALALQGLLAVAFLIVLTRHGLVALIFCLLALALLLITPSPGICPPGTAMPASPASSRPSSSLSPRSTPPSAVAPPGGLREAK